MKLVVGSALFLSAGLFFNGGSVAFAQDANWFYPVTAYESRITVKNFGTLINNDFYEAYTALFPGLKLYGYHAGVDLEAFANEQQSDVSVYAIATGKIILATTAQGYGGVIVQSLPNNATALYGHVKVDNLAYKTGDTVKGGKKITSLGNAFTQETGGERKHLHFAIHKGATPYLKGHEDTLALLNNKWENPSQYLKDNKAIRIENLAPSPFFGPSLTPTNHAIEKDKSSSKSLLFLMINYIKELFN